MIYIIYIYLNEFIYKSYIYIMYINEYIYERFSGVFGGETQV